jgi:peptidyl-prolyl cis-trans isomerase D
MMRQMRENTKWIMLITAAAFVALMVFEWGMDASGQSGGAGDVGRVGSTNVGVVEYQNVYRNLYDQIQRSQDEPISSQQNREIEDMAWNEIVNQILVQEELDRRGIRVSDDEIRRAARTSPPEEFLSDPSFQTDGQFDPQRYEQFLAQASQDPRFLQQLEQYYRDIIPRSKLVSQLTSGVYVSDRQLWEEFREQNEQVEVTFLALPARDRVPDSEVEVTRDEIESYYNENRDEFSVPAAAQVRYAYMTKAATAQDTAAAEDRARSVYEELQAGDMDFADLADLESDDRGTAQDGGRMDPFTRGDWPEALDEVAFSIPIGEVSEPIRTASGWHILEVLSRDEDQVEEARHIFFSFDRSDDSEIRLLTRADSLEAMGRNMTVEDAASELGVPVRTGEITEDYSILAGVGQADEAQEWIFEEREGIGAVSPVFENRDAFYMIEILSQSRSGYLSVDDVADQIERRLRMEKKVERTLEEGRGLVEELRNGAALEDVAEGLGLEARSSGAFTRTEFVPGLGTRNAAIGAAFGQAPGEIAGPLRIGDQVIILRVDERIEADREAWEAQRPIQRAQRTAQIRQDRLDRWIDGLREVTQIRDNRAEYFRMAEEQADQPQIPMAF